VDGPKLAEWAAKHRQLALTAIGLVLITLLLIRFGFLAERDISGNIDVLTVVRRVLDGLIASIVVSGLVTFGIWWTKPPLALASAGSHAGFEPILPREISKYLEQAARETDEWEYCGHTGRYVCSRIFPILEDAVKHSEKRIRVRMTIIDPRDSAACEYYANYRRLSRSHQMFNEDWTARKTQVELVATILTTLRLAQSTPRIIAEIGLGRRVMHMRVDRASSELIATLEDPQEQAFRCLHGSAFYRYYRSQCEMDWEQCSLHIPSAQTKLALDDPTSAAEALRSILGESGNFSDDLVRESFGAIAKGRSRYA
jgi:hypothetical protein